MKIKERNQMFYTNKGIAALRNRLKNIIKLFNENKFPIRVPILDFSFASISSREDCKRRIEELSQLIGYPLKIKKEIEKIGENEIIIKENIIYSEKWQ